jgi:hypothetical protein
MNIEAVPLQLDFQWRNSISGLILLTLFIYQLLGLNSLGPMVEVDIDILRSVLIELFAIKLGLIYVIVCLFLP